MRSGRARVLQQRPAMGLGAVRSKRAVDRSNVNHVADLSPSAPYNPACEPVDAGHGPVKAVLEIRLDSTPICVRRRASFSHQGAPRVVHWTDDKADGCGVAPVLQAPPTTTRLERAAKSPLCAPESLERAYQLMGINRATAVPTQPAGREHRIPMGRKARRLLPLLARAHEPIHPVCEARYCALCTLRGHA